MSDTKVTHLVNSNGFDDMFTYMTSNEPLKIELKCKKDTSTLIEIVDDVEKGNLLNIFGNVDLEENSSIKIVLISFSSRDVKADITCNIEENASANIDVAAIASEKIKKSFDIKTIHLKGNSNSLTKMYGVLLDSAKLEFLGTSDIKKGAKKSKTRQEGKIADLSVNGNGQVSPILKIAEDDVKASHGAALGKIPEDSLFYMMTRGLTKKEASGLITIGYLKPIVQEISSPEVKEHLLNYVSEERFAK